MKPSVESSVIIETKCHISHWRIFPLTKIAPITSYVFGVWAIFAFNWGLQVGTPTDVKYLSDVPTLLAACSE